MPYSHGAILDARGPINDTWLGPYFPPHMQIAFDTGPVGATYVTANRAFFYPVRVVRPLIVRHAFWTNGAAVSGNIDVALYDRVGTRLVSTGSTAQAGISVNQTVDVTDTLIGPGIFYVAVAMDNTTGAVFQRTESAALNKMMGAFTQDSAFPLPANATFATAASSRIVFIGFACRVVI